MAFCPGKALSARSVVKVNPANPVLITLNVKVAIVPLPVKLDVDWPID